VHLEHPVKRDRRVKVEIQASREEQVKLEVLVQQEGTVIYIFRDINLFVTQMSLLFVKLFVF